MVPNDTGRSLCLIVGDSSSETKTNAILRAFEDYTFEIIHSSATCTVMPASFDMGWQDYIINPEVSELPVKYYRVGQRGDIISRSGKIVSLWNSWQSKWMVWYAPRIIDPIGVSPSKFIRRFRGNNRGRHFDRKYKP